MQISSKRQPNRQSIINDKLEIAILADYKMYQIIR